MHNLENAESRDVPTANEVPPCPLCGTCEDGLQIGTKGRFAMSVRNVICYQCTLVYQSPRPDEERMAGYYAGLYRVHYGKVRYGRSDLSGTAAPDDEKSALKHWHENQVNFVSLLNPPKKGSRVLEVGCKDGLTLATMAERYGIVAYGIEPGKKEAEEARSAGIECFAGVLRDFDPRETRFDQIQIFHVLEHLHEPLKDLIRMRQWLAPGGKIVIEVPNVYQPYGELEGNFFQNAHLANFSPMTIRELLRRAGFDVLAVIDGATLLAMGTPSATVQCELPLAFDKTQLQPVEEDVFWVAERLIQYNELEVARQKIAQGDCSRDVIARLSRAVGAPAFLPHLIDTVASSAESLVKLGRFDSAQTVVEAAAEGPHPQEVIVAFRKFASSISGNAA